MLATSQGLPSFTTDPAYRKVSGVLVRKDGAVGRIYASGSMTHKFSLELYRAAMGDYPSVFEHLARPLEVVWSSNRFNTTYHGGVIEVGDGEELPENGDRRLEVELASQRSPEEQAEHAAADKKNPKDAQVLFAERNGIKAWSNRVPARFPNIGLVIFKKSKQVV